jgi:hypothetical protein
MLVVGEVNVEFRTHKSTMKALVVFLQKPVVLGALRNSGCPGRICVLQGGKWKPLDETAGFILAHREAIQSGDSELRLPGVPLPRPFVQYLEVVEKLSGYAAAGRPLPAVAVRCGRGWFVPRSVLACVCRK